MVANNMLCASMSVMLCVAVICFACAEARIPNTKYVNPDDWYYCGKDPAKGPPTIPPMTQSNLNLIAVQALFRHGDRTSFSWYPTPGSLGTKLQCWPNDTAVWDCSINYLNYPSPNNDITLLQSTGTLFRKVYDSGKNVLAGNCDVGQLTKKGFEQELTNGMMLRNYYTNKLGFLPQNLTAANINSIHVRSDDEPRTVLSALGVLLGLFPPSNNSTNVVVDVHTRSRVLGVMASNPNLCPRLKQVYDAARKSPAFQQFVQSTLTPLATKLSSILGVAVSTDNLEDLLDCSNGHFCHNYALYPGIDLNILQSLENAAVWEENYLNSYPNVIYNAKRGIGFLVSEMFDGLQAKLTDESAPSLMLFSGHDTTIMPWLTAYGVPPTQWAGYASILLVELYTDNSSGEPYVRVIYNQQVQNLPGCGGPLCPWDVYSQLSQAVISTDYEADCAPQ